MTAKEIDYLIHFYCHLMSEKESTAWTHIKYNMKLDSESSDQLRNMYYKRGLLTRDPEILLLFDNGDDQFKNVTALRILKDSESEIIFNRCKQCNELARTPLAQQCRYCGFDWH